MTDLAEIAAGQSSLASSSRAATKRASGRSRLLVAAIRLVAAAIVVGAWQIFAGGPKALLPADAVSRPSSIVDAFWHLLTSDQLLSGVAATVEAVAYGMLIAAPAGLLLAGATAVPVGRWLLEPIVTITYAIPKVGLISLYALILGPTAKTHIAVVVSAVAFTYYYGLSQSLRDLDRSRLAALRLMGAGPLRIIRLLVLPSAIPELFAATRIALPLAFALQVYSELRVPSTNGLGALLATFSQTLDSADAMALLLVVVVIAYVLDIVVGGALLRYTKSIGLGMLK